MKNKAIKKLAVCIAFAMVIPASVILITENMLAYQIVGVCAIAGYILGIIEILTIGSSDRNVKISTLSQAIDVGYILTFLAGIYALLAFVTLTPYVIIATIAIALIQIMYHIIFPVLGKQMYYRRLRRKV
ncbi:MAG: hypothetical protein IKC10_05555 [Alphaproteobacteria bacterium]|nr:hypothetical protein [Alphaproteobacteria bacterium]